MLLYEMSKICKYGSLLMTGNGPVSELLLKSAVQSVYNVSRFGMGPVSLFPLTRKNHRFVVEIRSGMDPLRSLFRASKLYKKEFLDRKGILPDAPH